jgi:hypothetical protein
MLREKKGKQMRKIGFVAAALTLGLSLAVATSAEEPSVSVGMGSDLSVSKVPGRGASEGKASGYKRRGHSNSARSVRGSGDGTVQLAPLTTLSVGMGNDVAVHHTRKPHK